MKYTLGSFAPSYIFHNQHKTLNNLYVDDSSHAYQAFFSVFILHIVCMTEQMKNEPGNAENLSFSTVQNIQLQTVTGLCSEGFGELKVVPSVNQVLEYPQHMFWLRNKKINFLICTL